MPLTALRTLEIDSNAENQRPIDELVRATETFALINSEFIPEGGAHLGQYLLSLSGEFFPAREEILRYTPPPKIQPGPDIAKVFTYVLDTGEGRGETTWQMTVSNRMKNKVTTLQVVKTKTDLTYGLACVHDSQGRIGPPQRIGLETIRMFAGNYLEVLQGQELKERIVKLQQGLLEKERRLTELELSMRQKSGLTDVLQVSSEKVQNEIKEINDTIATMMLGKSAVRNLLAGMV